MRALLLIGLLAAGDRASQDLRLEVPTSVVAGASMAVRASPKPIAGMRIALLDAGGRLLQWYEAGSDGEVALSIDVPAAYTLRWAAPDGTEVLAPFHVLAPHPEWFTGWWTVPLGLVLAGLGVRRARSRVAEASTASSAGPSLSAPQLNTLSTR